jgi:hypothetical protein
MKPGSSSAACSSADVARLHVVLNERLADFSAFADHVEEYLARG